ncbi:hypothetical protein PW52_05060 [Tamlana sedimentorum]|uniref:Uncharacterized protein n=1 Tax=Neotamlana sedimentorum TaxID=1435349 RepID=A0A0D7WA22_9FLAO|nr:hypothetical protein [Tamlana sedimentorum]KJD35991.1 hypothetical protein PW52_05060 [Tamlana sedimentorum]
MSVPKTDIKEQHDIADKYTDKVKELKDLLIRQIKEELSTQGKTQQNDIISSPWSQAQFAFQ